MTKVKNIIKALCPPIIWNWDKVDIEKEDDLNESGLALKEWSSQDYWEDHNVTNHVQFESPEESLGYFHWRCDQYYGYLNLMPVDQANGLTVLDYGCGPGHDLVGFGEYSQPKRLIGMDVSSNSLDQAKKRCDLHGIEVEFIHIDENEKVLPLDDNSIDIIHSSGVLHHTPDPIGILKEFKRILKPEGYVQIMVYNYDSIWMHLYTAYMHMVLQESIFGEFQKKDVFTKTTDGYDCPIAECYKPSEFSDMATLAGFKCSYIGAAISVYEMSILDKRFEAIASLKLDEESRMFLRDLEFNDKGFPMHQGHVAGVDACFRLVFGS